MLVTSFIVMAVGLAGLIFCAKKQKTNPAMQPVAILCLLVVLAGFGIYLYQQNSPQNYAEDDLVFEASSIVKAGKCLMDNVKDAKVLYVVHPITLESENGKKLKEFVEKKLGTTIEMAAPEAENPAEYIPEMNFKVADFEKILQAHSDCNAVITSLLPVDLKANSPIFEKRVMVLLQPSPIINRILPRLAKEGKVIAVVNYKSNFDIEKEPDDDDMNATFDVRYVMIEKDALAKQK